MVVVGVRNAEIFKRREESELVLLSSERGPEANTETNKRKARAEEVFFSSLNQNQAVVGTTTPAVMRSQYISKRKR